MKWETARIAKGALFLLTLLLFVTSSSLIDARVASGLSMSQCRKLFTWGEACDRERNVDGTIYRVVRDVDRVAIGHAFKKTFRLDKNESKLLVGIHNDGRIAKVIFKGEVELAAQFFLQFEGKSIQDSFEVASKPTDLLFVPERIKSVEGHIETCQRIAKEVEKTLDLWQQLKREPLSMAKSSKTN